MLWTESTTTSLGCVCSMCAEMLSRCVSASTRMFGEIDAQPLGAQLDLRGRLLAGDVEDTAARAVGQRRRSTPGCSSVLLPMPGSPLISTTEPGTMPPPSTRLNSPMRHGDALVAVGGDVGQGMRAAAAGGDEPRRRARPGAGSWTTVSTSVFHSPQSGHLPCHFGCALPQTWQT